MVFPRLVEIQKAFEVIVRCFFKRVRETWGRLMPLPYVASSGFFFCCCCFRVWGVGASLRATEQKLKLKLRNLLAHELGVLLLGRTSMWRDVGWGICYYDSWMWDRSVWDLGKADRPDPYSWLTHSCTCLYIGLGDRLVPLSFSRLGKFFWSSLIFCNFWFLIMEMQGQK